MKKRIIPLIIIFVLLLSISANAVETRAVSVTPSLSFSGTTAKCSVSIIETGKEIEATLELWCGNTRIDSWSDSGTSYLVIREECGVTKGNTYTLKVILTVDNQSVPVHDLVRTC